MRLRGTGAPPSAVKDLTTTQSSGGRKVRIDKKRQFTPSPTGPQHAETPRLQTEDPHRSTVHRRQSRSTRLIMQQPWRSHQSVPIAVKNQGGDCQYALCPGLKRNNLRKRPYPTRYQCEECSIKKGTPVWLCNSTKKHADGSSRAILCHMKHHSARHITPETSPTAAAASEGTQESAPTAAAASFREI